VSNRRCVHGYWNEADHCPQYLCGFQENSSELDRLRAENERLRMAIRLACEEVESGQPTTMETLRLFRAAIAGEKAK